MTRSMVVPLVIILTLVVASVSLAAEWTIMVYSSADNNLDLAGVEDLNELEYAGSTDQVNMLYLLDRYGWFDTKLYYVLQDTAGSPEGTDMNIISQDISSSAPWLEEEEDMGNPQTLQDFVLWTMQNFPANHYLLSIWDHGNGIFIAEGRGITKGECWDDHGGIPGEYIDLEELRDVLAAAYSANGNQKIDIVGHDVCVLGQIETHYQMKDFVKIGIASEESEPEDGWEYGLPFYDLVNNPLMTPEELASKIVEYYCQRYGHFHDITQAAVDLSALESVLIPRLNAFCELLIYHMYDFQSDIISAHSNAEYYNWDCGRNPELFHFAQLIQADNDLPDTLRSAAQELMSCYPGVVISECHGDWCANANGMTIWFTEYFLTNYCKDDYLTKIEFSRESWDEFLAQFDDPQPIYKGPVWYVSTAGDDSTGDGSLDKPFRTIQKGINRANVGDTVLVATGHYYERINFRGKKILVAGSVQFGEETTRSDFTTIDADTSVLGVTDTGSVVVFASGEDSTSIIDGFVLKNGIGTLDQFDNRAGGGICCCSSSPTIRNNIITSNSASFGGGVDCSWSSSPTVSSNIMTRNSASSGGAVSCRESSSPAIHQNIITENSADDGGGIFCGRNCLCVISHNTINGNYGMAGGGIMCDWNASPVITNNIISNSVDGEGIHSIDEAWPSVSHNDFWNNADGNFYGGQPGIGDTTWGANFNHTPCDSFYNIIKDPLFADTLIYSLLCSSSCIDAGNSGFEVPDSGGRRIDIGVYEYPYIMGDVTQEGEVTISDAVYLISCLFTDGPCPCPSGKGDVNCNQYVEIVDVVYLINYLFKSGPEPGC